jgi:hypothetical protein
MGTPLVARPEKPLPVRLPHRFSGPTLQQIADVLAANLLAARQREREASDV